MGRHFRIASRDASKSTADSFISAYFYVGHPEKQLFIGQIHQILRLNYDSVKPVLLKAKWYDNDVTDRRASTTLVQDECGIQRVLAKKFMDDHLVRHEPFVFPAQCNQVFLVPDRLHPDWQLVVDTEVRKMRPTLPKPFEEVTISAERSASVEEDDDIGMATVGSDSEEEGEGENLPEEFLYPEEILTYKRRPAGFQPIRVDSHTLERPIQDDILSDDETAPHMEEFPVIET
jgi:hypothetical protein